MKLNLNTKFSDLLIRILCFLACGVSIASAAGNIDINKKNTVEAKAPPVNKSMCKFITDSQGRKFVEAKMGIVTYRVPDEFIGGGTCNAGEIFLGIRWPSLKGFKTLTPGGEDVDAYRVILSPPKNRPAVDSYVTQNRIHKFDERKNPSEYPGLLYLKKNGKQLPILLSGENWPKTPSGNPFIFLVGVPVNKFFHTTLVFSNGSSIVINDAHIHKYMNEWDRLFPSFIRLIQSFEQKD